MEKIFILEKLKIHLSGNCSVPSSSIFPSSDEGSFYVSSIIALNRLETLFTQKFAQESKFSSLPCLFSVWVCEKYTSEYICENSQKNTFSQVTHSPPRGILDKNAASSASGCAALAKELSSR